MRSSWWRSCPVLLLLAVGTGAGAAQGGTSVADTVRATVIGNPQIDEVRNDRLAVDQELAQARALQYPSIDLRITGGPRYTRYRDRRPPFDEDSFNEAQGLAILTQRLYDGGATQSEIARQLARVDSAARRVTEAAELIGLDGVQAHLETLRSQEIVELARRNLRRQQTLLDQVRRLAEGGAVGESDLRQAETRTAAARTTLEQTLGALEDARATYQEVVGRPPVDLVRDPPPNGALPDGIELAAALASTQSPTVLIAAADVDAAEAELEAARSGYYPRLDLELRGGANGNTSDLESERYEASAQLVMRYNLFRGGGDIAREREAFHRVNVARATLVKNRRRAEQDARSYWNALQTATNRVRSLRQQVEASRRTRDLYLQEFQIGRRSLLDLLDSDAELFQTEVTLVTAGYTRDFAVYRLLATVGRMLAALGVPAPPESVDRYRTAERDQTPERVTAKSRPRLDLRAKPRPLRGADRGEPAIEGRFRTGQDSGG